MLRRLLRIPEITTLGLPRREVDSIARASMLVSLPAGMQVGRTGQMIQEWFLLTSGSMSVRRDGVEIARVEALAPVGEVGSDSRTFREADVYTAEPCTALVIARREWSALQQMAPRFAAWVKGHAVDPSRLVSGSGSTA